MADIRYAWVDLGGVYHDEYGLRPGYHWMTWTSCGQRVRQLNVGTKPPEERRLCLRCKHRRATCQADTSVHSEVPPEGAEEWKPFDSVRSW